MELKFEQRAVAASLMLALSCAHTGASSDTVASGELPGTDGRSHDLVSEISSNRATVLIFFSPDCPIQRAHDARLVSLQQRYVGRGVAFYFIDSNFDATMEEDRTEAANRGFAFPILLDAGGAQQRAFGAEYATYSVVLDARGKARYRGAIDSDKSPLTEAPQLYLENAVEAVLGGNIPSPPKTEALGCGLKKW